MGDSLKDLPYMAEYAKSGRASCKGCGSTIDKDELRLAIMVQSRFHDGRDAHWHHATCFFNKARPKTVGDISHYESLRWNDQELIRKKIENGQALVAKTAQKSPLKDYFIGYAKSAASTCVACEQKIPKQDIRVSKKDYESEKAIMFCKGAGLDRWHHLDCFVKVRESLEFFARGKELPGFRDLEPEDKKMVEKKLPLLKPQKKKEAADKPSTSTSASSSAGKRKGGDADATNGSNSGSSKRLKTEKGSVEDLMRQQNDQMFKYRDALGGYRKAELTQILNTNKQEIPQGESKMLDRITDIMTFGTLKRCPKCKDGQIVFRSGVGYQCLGDLNEFTKCMNVLDNPERVPFKVPNDLREKEPFASYKFKPQQRAFRKLAPSETTTSASHTPKLVKAPLSNFNFVVCDSNKETVEKWTNKIQEFGGKVLKTVSSKVAAVVATQAEVDKKSTAIKSAKKRGVPILKPDFVESLTELNYNLADEMRKNLLCDWVPDVLKWLRSKNGDYEETSRRGAEKKDAFEKHLSSVKLKMKGGAVVDPDSELDDVGHVLKNGTKGFFSCVLNRTSIEDGKNSYYKMQIIETDAGRNYYVFQAWGRIGTTIGGQKLHDDLTKSEAIDIFCSKFLDLTKNEWGKTFKKKPEAYTMLDIDFGKPNEAEQKKLVPSAKESSLPMSVQELVCLIFDVSRMKEAMVEFELNLEEMPLGKISRKQIMNAYGALSEVSNALHNGQSGTDIADKIRDGTNRFYTLIPHNFGSRMPPLLDNSDLVKVKLEMLESLLDIELAYEMLLEGEKGKETSLDSHYKKLHTAVEPLESGCEEFEILDKYLQNTHAETHSSYSLEIEHVFKVKRSGENERFEAFKGLHNKMLLWHGSRTTNYAGILNHGLKIAPPEAPVTGYMFGKGIYFADMVSKSANYCNTSPDNSTGLLLLCEVALGNMHELKRAKESLSKAPKDCHSVKGCGQTEPNPTESATLPGDIKVPFGKPVKAAVKNSDLMYNEYIVYDVGQVNIRYLLKVNFNYSSRKRR